MRIPYVFFVATAATFIVPPVLIWSVLAVRRGRTTAHAIAMTICGIGTLAVVAWFLAAADQIEGLDRLMDTFFYKWIHRPIAYGAVLGIVWQFVSRAIPRLRPVHRKTGPWVIGLWFASFFTGLWNFWYLYFR